MKTTTFRIDLGQGDFADVTLSPETSLKDFIDQVKDSGEWLIYGNTSIQKSHIKRISLQN